MADTFNKGESVDITMTLLDGTSVLDTGIFVTIEVEILDYMLRPLGTYTLADAEISRLIPTTDGEIFFVVPEAVSATGRIGKYFFKLTTTEADADYPDSVRTRMASGLCFNLIY